MLNAHPLLVILRRWDGLLLGSPHYCEPYGHMVHMPLRRFLKSAPMYLYLEAWACYDACQNSKSHVPHSSEDGWTIAFYDRTFKHSESVIMIVSIALRSVIYSSIVKQSCNNHIIIVMHMDITYIISHLQPSAGEKSWRLSTSNRARRSKIFMNLAGPVESQWIGNSDIFQTQPLPIDP